MSEFILFTIFVVVIAYFIKYHEEKEKNKPIQEQNHLYQLRGRLLDLISLGASSAFKDLVEESNNFLDSEFYTIMINRTIESQNKEILRYLKKFRFYSFGEVPFSPQLNIRPIIYENNMSLLKIMIQGEDINNFNNYEYEKNRICNILFDNDFEPLEMIRFCISKGLSVEGHCCHRGHPIVVAAKRNKYKTVKLLIDSGVNLNSTDYFDESSFERHIRKNEKEPLKIIGESIKDKKNYKIYELIINDTSISKEIKELIKNNLNH